MAPVEQAMLRFFLIAVKTDLEEDSVDLFLLASPCRAWCKTSPPHTFHPLPVLQCFFYTDILSSQLSHVIRLDHEFVLGTVIEE